MLSRFVVSLAFASAAMATPATILSGFQTLINDTNTISYFFGNSIATSSSPDTGNPFGALEAYSSAIKDTGAAIASTSSLTETDASEIASAVGTWATSLTSLAKLVGEGKSELNATVEEGVATVVSEFGAAVVDYEALFAYNISVPCAGESELVESLEGVVSIFSALASALSTSFPSEKVTVCAATSTAASNVTSALATSSASVTTTKTNSTGNYTSSAAASGSASATVFSNNAGVVSTSWFAALVAAVFFSLM